MLTLNAVIHSTYLCGKLCVEYPQPLQIPVVRRVDILPIHRFICAQCNTRAHIIQLRPFSPTLAGEQQVFKRRNDKCEAWHETHLFKRTQRNTMKFASLSGCHDKLSHVLMVYIQTRVCISGYDDSPLFYRSHHHSGHPWCCAGHRDSGLIYVPVKMDKLTRLPITFRDHQV